MDRRITALFERIQASGLADLAGAGAAVTVPVAERLLNEIVAEWLPRSGPVREVQVKPRAGNRIGLRARLGRGSFPPPLSLTLVIDRQPELPQSPVLVFRLEMGGFLTLAGPVLRFLDALPPGIRVERDRLYVDLRGLLASQGLEWVLQYVEHLQVDTAEGSVILSVRAAVQPGHAR